MWFVDSSFVEGVHYAIFFSEEAALAHGVAVDRIAPSSAPVRFWMCSLGAPVSFMWWCLLFVVSIVQFPAVLVTIVCTPRFGLYLVHARAAADDKHLNACAFSRPSSRRQNLAVWKRVMVHGQWAAAA